MSRRPCANYNYHLYCRGDACDREDCTFDHRDELPPGTTAEALQDIPLGKRGICSHWFRHLYGVGEGCNNPKNCRWHHADVSTGLTGACKWVGGGLWRGVKFVGGWTVQPLVHHGARAVAYSANRIARATAAIPRCRDGPNCEFFARGCCRFDHSGDSLNERVLPDRRPSPDVATDDGFEVLDVDADDSTS